VQPPSLLLPPPLQSAPALARRGLSTGWFLEAFEQILQAFIAATLRNTIPAPLALEGMEDELFGEHRKLPLQVCPRLRRRLKKLRPAPWLQLSRQPLPSRVAMLQRMLACHREARRIRAELRIPHHLAEDLEALLPVLGIIEL